MAFKNKKSNIIYKYLANWLSNKKVDWLKNFLD
jgi:hypothetical protein